jgi:hypothetical protein
MNQIESNRIASTELEYSTTVCTYPVYHVPTRPGRRMEGRTEVVSMSPSATLFVVVVVGGLFR